mmetsp:Transcript_61287/g.134731  ORF Transcript_61287/g.134731 Transcript_61287/m.134731 type:complete len:204 (+) Transcript_61287:944-1555(+)
MQILQQSLVLPLSRLPPKQLVGRRHRKQQQRHLLQRSDQRRRPRRQRRKRLPCPSRQLRQQPWEATPRAQRRQRRHSAFRAQRRHSRLRRPQLLPRLRSWSAEAEWPRSRMILPSSPWGHHWVRNSGLPSTQAPSRVSWPPHQARFRPFSGSPLGAHPSKSSEGRLRVRLAATRSTGRPFGYRLMRSISLMTASTSISKILSS